MKETELKEVMNEVADRIYESAYANLQLAHDFWMDSRKAETENDWEARVGSAKDFYSRAVEDLSIISELTGQDWEALYDKAPYPFSEEEITKWWE